MIETKIDLVDRKVHPNLAFVVESVLSVWPEHARFLRDTLAPREEAFLNHSERLSGLIVRLAADSAGGIDAIARDYRFLG